MKYCRGQCYDGAGNMAGKTKGAAARIMQQNSLALYTHRASHKLNLCVASSCKVQSVKNMMENVRVISDFFNNSPKRQQLLEAMLKEHLPDSRQSTLIDVYCTRWVQRIDGLSRFCEMHFSITEALSATRDNTNGEWSSSAAAVSSLASVCSDFNFIVPLVIVANCLAYVKPATIKFQSSLIDIRNAFETIAYLIDSVKEVRGSIDRYFSSLYDFAFSLANKVGAAIRKPRTCAKQLNRSSICVSDTKAYYKVNVMVPFIDHLIMEMSTRFSKQNCNAMKGFVIVPAVRMSKTKIHSSGLKRSYDQSFTHKSLALETGKLIHHLDQLWRRQFSEFCSVYENDLPNLSNLVSELDNWHTYWLKLFLGDFHKQFLKH